MIIKRNSLLDELLAATENSFAKTTQEIVPASNIIDNENSFEIYLAVPGLDKTNFDISIKEELLTVSDKSEKNTEKKENEAKRIYASRGYNFKNFSKTFTLPKDIVDKENISAKYENGELIITLPKKEKEENKALSIAVK
ncbi:MAG: heat-shock protein Hsp20 [Bacteroidetes bacterium 4572_112]|nr:MAG: heat-shock protein Hsp20 [Bacteroidetes bacterium 4572_112]